MDWHLAGELDCVAVSVALIGVAVHDHTLKVDGMLRLALNSLRESRVVSIRSKLASHTVLRATRNKVGEGLWLTVEFLPGKFHY